MTTEPELAAGPRLPGRPALLNLLVRGFALARRNWPFVVWAYAINLVFGLLSEVPFANGLAPLLDHSLAAQKIAGTLDLAYLAELGLHLRATQFFSMAVHTAGWLNLLQLLILTFLFAGTVFVYMSAEPPLFSVLLRGGAAYFWRFLRAAIMVGCAAVLVLGLLMAIRGALLAWLGETYFGYTLFIYASISGAIIFLAGLLFRLWLDLVEVYIVRNAMDGELRAHRALLPAGKLLLSQFFRISGCFLLAGLAALCAFGLCLLLWKMLPPEQVWAAALLAQVGLFCLLAGRFWQRGMEAALVMAIDPPVIIVEEAVETVEEEQTVSLAGVAGQAGLAEPTLFELVQKLRTEPWAATPLPPPAEATPPRGSGLADPTVVQIGEEEGEVSPIDRHTAKFPLGGTPPVAEPAPTTAAETNPPAADPEKPQPPVQPPGKG